MFNSGELVQLKSGGPIMTVVSVDVDNQVTCTWFDSQQVLQTSHFVSQTLMRYEEVDYDNLY